MLSPADVRLLERMALAPRGLTAPTGSPALRHANVRGHGLEFHDFRAYQPGDDPRAVDWTVHARLGQLVVRTNRAEGQLRLHLLVDTSLSMSLGRPTKFAAASRLAGALAYIAVRQRDAVGVTTFDRRVRTVVAPAAGRGQLFRVLSTLAGLVPAGGSSLDEGLSGYGALVKGPGLVVVISDLFDPRGTTIGLRYLQHRGLQPALVHITADDELEPAFDDDVELSDVERPGEPPLVVSPETVEVYRRRLAAWTASLQSSCSRDGIPWVSLRSSFPLDTMLSACRRARLVIDRS